MSELPELSVGTALVPPVYSGTQVSCFRRVLNGPRGALTTTDKQMTEGRVFGSNARTTSGEGSIYTGGCEGDCVAEARKALEEAASIARKSGCSVADLEKRFQLL